MIEAMKAAVLMLFAWTVITLLLSWVLSLLYPLLRRGLITQPAMLRTPLTLTIGFAPGVLALAALGLHSLAGWSTWLVAPHCHNGVCGPHGLHMPVATHGGMSAVALALAAFLLLGLLMTRQWFLGRKYLLVLNALSDPQKDLQANADYRLIDSEKPLAWCAGVMQPQVYVSRGLLQQLTATQLKTVLAHEYAHAMRRDNLRKLLLHWSTLPWPKAMAACIRADFSTDTECLCDLAAAGPSPAAEQTSGHVASALGVIEQYCMDAKAPHTHLDHAQRLTALRQEMACARELPGRYWLRRTKVWASTVAGLLLLLMATIHISHPLLEWLSR